MTEQTSTEQNQPQALPPVLAGPILRPATSTQLTLWLVGSAALLLRLKVTGANNICFDKTLSDSDLYALKFGEHAYLYLIDVTLLQPLTADCGIAYDRAITETISGARTIEQDKEKERGQPQT